MSVKNPAETVRRGLNTLALSSRRFSDRTPAGISTSTHHGPVAAASAGHVPPPLSIRLQSMQSKRTVLRQSGRCQSTDQSVSRCPNSFATRNAFVYVRRNVLADLLVGIRI